MFNSHDLARYRTMFFSQIFLDGSFFVDVILATLILGIAAAHQGQIRA